MNTKDLVEFVSTTPAAKEVSKAAVERILLVALEKISTEVSAGNEVSLRNFGRFYQHERNARTARNPKTGDVVQVPAKKVVKFAARGNLKDQGSQEGQESQASQG
jgi:DNA-binding protein HU-beta